MKLNNRMKIYIGLLAIIALFSFAFLLFNFEMPKISSLAFWTILSVVVESLLILLPNNNVGVSVGYAINIATIIVGGPLLATTASALGLLFRCPKIDGRGYVHALNTPVYKVIYNISQSIIVTSIISIVYQLVGARIGEFSLIPAILILLLGILLNTTIISGFLTFATEQKFYSVWVNNVKGMFASAVSVGTMGIIIALAYIGYGYGAVILFMGPLLLARYSFKLYVEMRNLYLSTIHALNKSLEAKDPYTSGHASRVEQFAIELAEAYNLPYNKVQDIKTAAVLHDIGKIGINDGILNKAAKLTQEEYEHIMKHPVIGAEIISKVDFLKNITGIIKHHHEKYDGTGYPDGLKGEDIPIEACILTIADSYDAMTTNRPYRAALTKEQALEEIQKYAGTQFHPALAKAFVDMMNHHEV